MKQRRCFDEYKELAEVNKKMIRQKQNKERKEKAQLCVSWMESALNQCPQSKWIEVSDKEADDAFQVRTKRGFCYSMIFLLLVNVISRVFNSLGYYSTESSYHLILMFLLIVITVFLPFIVYQDFHAKDIPTGESEKGYSTVTFIHRETLEYSIKKYKKLLKKLEAKENV